MFGTIRKWANYYFQDEEAVLLIALIIGSMVVIAVLGQVLIPFLGSLVVAYLLQGLINSLVARKVPYWIAFTFCYVLFLGVLTVVIFLVLPLAWNQLAHLFNALPSMFIKGQKVLFQFPLDYPDILSAEQLNDWVELAKNEVGAFGQKLLSFSFTLLPNLVNILVYLVLVPVLVFFLLKDKTYLVEWFVSRLPTRRPFLSSIWTEMDQQLSNYVQGKVIEIIITGAATFILFVSLGLNYAALLALLVGLSVVVPYIGVAIVTIPVALIGYFQWGATDLFVYLMAGHLILQILDGYVLVPLLFSEAVNLHPVAIILSVLVFGSFWGFWGVFFAIPLATFIKAAMTSWPRAIKQVHQENAETSE
ncbi:MAG: AI-2E family transporter [Pseudomonadales bacterium]|jgi:putative permease|nr:AI-2E family transporter [Pseudomonadales bacterium]